MWRLSLGQLTVSGVSQEVLIDAASSAGFDAVGLRLEARVKGEDFPFEATGCASRLKSIRERLDATGIRVSNVTGRYITPATTPDDLGRLVDAAAALGSSYVVAVGADPNRTRMTATLRMLVETAASSRLRVALEFIPYSVVSSYWQALGIIQAVESVDLGLMIDPLHLSRSGGTPADLAGAAERIFIAQVCDAKGAVPATRDLLIQESRGQRFYPGEGDLPLTELLRYVPTHADLEIEAPHPAFANASPAQRAKGAADSLRSFLSQPR